MPLNKHLPASKHKGQTTSILCCSDWRKALSMASVLLGVEDGILFNRCEITKGKDWPIYSSG